MGQVWHEGSVVSATLLGPKTSSLPGSTLGNGVLRFRKIRSENLMEF